MQCLYCGKGIGPIRQLRDLEFCSDEHRVQFKERYRRSLLEALAPEPAPSRLADFLEQAPVAGGPVPHVELSVMERPARAARGLRFEPPAIAVHRPDWILDATAVDMPAQPARAEETAAYSPSSPAANFRIRVDVAARSTAGMPPTAPAAVPQLEVASPVAGPACMGPAVQTVHAPILKSHNGAIASPAAPGGGQMAAAFTAARTEPARALLEPAPLAKAHDLSGLQPAAMPVALFLPKPPAVTEVSVGMAAPRVAQPQASVPVRESASLTLAANCVAPGMPAIVSGSPATSVSLAPPRVAQPETGVLVRSTVFAAARASRAVQPVAAGVGGPQPAAPLIAMHAAESDPSPHAASTELLPTSATSQCVAPALPLKESGTPELAADADTLVAAAAVSSPSWHAARTAQAPMGPLGEHVHPQMVSQAATAQAPQAAAMAAAPLADADGNRNPRTAPVAAAQVKISTTPTQLEAIASAVGSAPPRELGAPTPIAPAAASPTWDAARAAQAEHSLTPRADLDLPRIDCMPSPAGEIAASQSALPPSVGRSIRSCAVLWTLRVVRLCQPPFLAEPIRTKFSELVRPDAGLVYRPDAEDRRPIEINRRAVKKLGAPQKRKVKWQYPAMAAAAMLAAGVLLPRVATPKTFSASMPWHGTSIKHWVSERATRDYADDFRTGLSQWKGVQSKWPKSWSYSTDGYMHPGQLAIYQPSVPLSDYRFEFMAQIENKSVDWVVRAHDVDNYYALKFKVIQPGPRPMMAMVRYPVVNGSQGERVETPLRMMIHANTPYRVTVDVKGSHYRAFVEGQQADFWTEDRLKTGGVGFFSDAGERARVYWVKLESHGDLLGRICGLLSGKGSGGANNKENEANGTPACWYEGIERGVGPERQGCIDDRARGSYQPRLVESGLIASGWQTGRGSPGIGARAGWRRTSPGLVFRPGPTAV